jgi:DNA repair exonuclease SbcCD ATPase subunit
MDFLKELFETEEAFNNFAKKAKEKGLNLADLSKGEYVGKGKHESETKKLQAEAEAKIKALTEEFAKKEAEYKEKADKSTATLTEGEKAAKALQEQLAKFEKEQKKAQEQIEKLSKDNEAAKADSLFANRRALYIEAGGKAKNVLRDVEYLTKQVSDETTFEAALEAYKKENPDVFQKEKTEVISTTLDVKGGQKPTSEERAEVNRIRATQGLPEIKD